MNIFLQNRLKVSVFLLFFSFYTVITFPMNTLTISNGLSLKPQKTITIFDPAQDKSWRKVVPGSVMITPDGKGFVMGEYGQVRHSLFESKMGDIPKIIIEHPCAKEYIPMIAMVQKDRSLLVVSAGNYIDSEKKHVSEYIIFYNGWCKTKKLDRPIQTISLDSFGKTLAIAGLHSVVVVDIDTNQTDEIFFKLLNKNENWIVDVAVNKTGDSIIGVGSQNGVQLLSLTRKNDAIALCTLKEVESIDVIKNIYYSTPAELLYLTQDGKAKTIDMYHLLNVDQEIIATDFAHPPFYDKVVADPSGHIATAHWTNNVKANHRIKVYRKNNTCVEKFILEMPTAIERYDYVTEFGNRGQAPGHLLHVAIRGNCVVALATDGKMRVWSLPIEPIFCTQVDQEKLHEKLLSEYKAYSPIKKTISSHNLVKKNDADKHSKYVGIELDDSRGRKKVKSRENSPKRKGSK